MHFLIQNLGYVGLMLVSGGMLLWPEIDRMISGGAQVGTHEVTLLMNEKHALVLDLRSADDFAKARIPGARHLPPAELDTKVAALGKLKGRPVVLIGQRPVAVMRALRAAGFSEIVQLRGGMTAWQEAGLPTHKA
jgi:rhodanese-related sulfurtransferase